MSERYQWGSVGRKCSARSKAAPHVGLLLPSNALCDNRFNGTIIAVNTGWKPERDAKAVAGALRSSCLKRAGSESSEESRDVQEVLMRVMVYPARYWIAAKGENKRGDGMVDFSFAGNGRDGRWSGSHGDDPFWQ
ncbi:hypothetical protein ACVINZ_000203 [Mesorhizobium jarvisii]